MIEDKYVEAISLSHDIMTAKAKADAYSKMDWPRLSDCFDDSNRYDSVPLQNIMSTLTVYTGTSFVITKKVATHTLHE